MSIISALVSEIEETRENPDKVMEACSVFLDLAKDSDIVKHDILIQKLEFYGPRGQAANLITNFLSERYQFVQIAQNISSTLKTHVGLL